MKTVEELLGFIAIRLLENGSVVISFEVEDEEFKGGHLEIYSGGKIFKFHSSEVRVLGLVNAIYRLSKKSKIKIEVEKLGGMSWKVKEVI